MNRSRGLPWLLLASTLLCALFVALGTWQVQRLGWKKALVARVEARVAAAPVAPPATTEWPALQADPAAYEYRRLRLQGELLHADEALVQASTALGAGYWVLTPLRQGDGTIVLVNRGFVPPERRDPAERLAPSPAGTVVINGLLRLPEPGGGFLRDNDPAAGRWFSRDVAAIAAARHLPAGRVAPYFVDAESTLPPGQWPAGGLTVLRFTDNHLVYALTWYTLAAMVVAAGVFVLRSARRPAD